MSVFTPISEQQLQEFLQQYNLGELINYQGIIQGTANSNFYVNTTLGKYVLTLFEKLSAAQLDFYLVLLQYLAANNIACAPPITDKQGRYLQLVAGKPTVIMPCLAGKMMTKVTPENCAAIGTEIAKLHLCGRSFNERHQNPFNQDWLQTTAAAVKPKLNAAQAKLLASELAIVSHIPWHSFPKGIIHADLFRDNALFEHQHLTGIIDFYYACYDVLLIDIAVIVNDWCLDQHHQVDEQLIHALLHAYSKHRPLTVAEKTYFKQVLRASALRYWLSRLDAKLNGPTNDQILTKDPAEYHDILLNLSDFQFCVSNY